MPRSASPKDKIRSRLLWALLLLYEVCSSEAVLRRLHDVVGPRSKTITSPSSVQLENSTFCRRAFPSSGQVRWDEKMSITVTRAITLLFHVYLPDSAKLQGLMRVVWYTVYLVQPRLNSHFAKPIYAEDVPLSFNFLEVRVTTGKSSISPSV